MVSLVNTHFLPALLLFLAAAIPISIIDLKEKRIPDIISLPVLGIILVFRIAVGHPLLGVFIDLGAGFLLFFLIWFFTEDALGFGDVKYAALISLTLGLMRWFLAIFSAAVIALAIAGVLLALKKIDKKTQIPFAPFLSAGAVIAFFIDPMMFVAL